MGMISANQSQLGYDCGGWGGETSKTKGTNTQNAN